MSGELIISQTDKRPIYFQIMEQIKQRISVGDWTDGQPIPSIRQMAVDLQVSVITVKRAYLELEREGIIITQHGKGSFVAPNVDLGTRIREQELGQHLEQAARLGSLLGLPYEELEGRLRTTHNRLAQNQEELV
jgi:GntR family transcriptional regulator